MIVKTRNGVFSNQGYGGGSFNKNTAFGAVGSTAERQHRYGDMSNLNAPYDNLSLQGLRGLGSLSGTSLGAETLTLQDLPTEDDEAAIATAYPWQKYSADTLALQKEINRGLLSRGYKPLLEDGLLGGRTCGALAMDSALGMVGNACDAHTEEFVAPVKGTVSTVTNNSSITNNSTVNQGDLVDTKKGVPPWVWGVLLGVGAVAAVVYAKKRKGRSVTLSTTYG